MITLKSNSFANEWHFHCMIMGKLSTSGMSSMCPAQFGYGSDSDGQYAVFVGRMAQETDDKGADEVSSRLTKL